jgi:hypothetical protein
MSLLVLELGDAVLRGLGGEGRPVRRFLARGTCALYESMEPMPRRVATALMAVSCAVSAACAPQGRPPSDIGVSEPGVPVEHEPAPHAPSSAATVPSTAPVTSSAAPPAASAKDGRVALPEEWPP